MNCQIVSDFHLEFAYAEKYVPKHIPFNGNILILCGDIGSTKGDKLKNFLELMSKNFEYIFYVAGNHEYYYGEYYESQKTLRFICNKFKNVHFLSKNYKVLDCKKSGKKVRFCGVTLWTNPPGKENRDRIWYMYNDYKQIRINRESTVGKGEVIIVEKKEIEEEEKKELKESKEKEKKYKEKDYLHVDDTVKMHKEELEWLETQIEEAKELNERIVIISHHCPVFHENALLEHEREHQYVIHGNCTDLTYFFEKNKNYEWIDYWFYGHTHNSARFYYKDIKFISNQVGYQDGKKTYYQSSLVVDLVNKVEKEKEDGKVEFIDMMKRIEKKEESPILVQSKKCHLL